jgi:hypothetical protein
LQCKKTQFIPLPLKPEPGCVALALPEATQTQQQQQQQPHSASKRSQQQQQQPPLRAFGARQGHQSDPITRSVEANHPGPTLSVGRFLDAGAQLGVHLRESPSQTQNTQAKKMAPANKAASSSSGGNAAGAAGSSAAAAVDAAAWWLNVSTSVVIVFVNKLLMDPKRGYGFSFGERERESLACCLLGGAVDDARAAHVTRR